MKTRERKEEMKKERKWRNENLKMKKQHREMGKRENAATGNID